MKRSYILILILSIVVGYILIDKYNRYKLLNLNCNFLYKKSLNIDNSIKIKLKRQYCYNIMEDTKKSILPLLTKVYNINIVNIINNELSTLKITKYNNKNLFLKLKIKNKHLMNCKDILKNNFNINSLSIELMHYPYNIVILGDKNMLHYLSENICKNKILLDK